MLNLDNSRDVKEIYEELLEYYRCFSPALHQADDPVLRMKANLERLAPQSTEEQIEAIRFLEYFLAVHLGQVDPQHEARRLELIARARAYSPRVSRKRMALRKWYRQAYDSSGQAV